MRGWRLPQTPRYRVQALRSTIEIKRKEMNSSNKDETIYLKHIEDIVDRKTNRAQLLLEQFNKQGNLDFFSHAKEDFSYSGL